MRLNKVSVPFDINVRLHYSLSGDLHNDYNLCFIFSFNGISLVTVHIVFVRNILCVTYKYPYLHSLRYFHPVYLLQ